MKNYIDFLRKVDTSMPSWDRLMPTAREYLLYKNKLRKKNLIILDIGCGKNAYLKSLVEKDDIYHGCDYHDKTKIKLKNYKKIDLNKEKLNLKYKNIKFDVIFCCEVIEHIFSPDNLLDEIKKIMHKDSILILSTPNLAYYINRFLLLFGISPLFLENSSDFKLGRKFKQLGQMNITEGHIKVFTYNALLDLLKLKRFKIVKIKPVTVWNFLPDKVVTRLSPSLSPDNIFVLKKENV
jgi:2-polyprenyl-3-methyl-5-hydroxy-6-metoxy-1,4-benzoquinol methylase